MEDSFEAGLPSLAEEREGEEEVGRHRLDTDRARKISLFNKTGSRFVDTSRPGPFRHSYIDVRVHKPVCDVLFLKGVAQCFKFLNQVASIHFIMFWAALKF